MLRVMMKPQGAGPQLPGAPPAGPGVSPGPGAPQPGLPPGLPPQLAAALGAGGGPPPEDHDTDLEHQDGGSSQTSQQIAGYMGPENGPFECERCKHFQDPGSCELVSGKIDPEGCCNLFEPDPSKQDTDSDDDEAPPDVASYLQGK